MGVKSVSVSTTGLVPNTSGLGIGMTQQSPTIAYINTNDSLATVLVSGYLNDSVQAFGVTYNNYQMALVHVTDNGGEQVWLSVYVTTSGSSHVYSLVSRAANGDVATPTVANQITYSTNTIGALASAGLTTALFNAGNISAGKSGTAGILASFPATAAKGSLRLTAVANTGDTLVTISNALHGQATVYSIGDIGAATGGLVAATTAIVMKSVAGAAAAGGAAAQSFTDAFCTSGSNVVGNWNTQANAASVLKIVPGTGSFVVTSSADAGVGTFNYIITK